MKIRGMNYNVGIKFSEDAPVREFNKELFRRELTVIRDDMHCNAVRISGTDIDRMEAACEIAMELGLEAWMSPHLHDKNMEETIRYTVECARAAERLRQKNPNIVFIFGCELMLFMDGILPGSTVTERLGNPEIGSLVGSDEIVGKFQSFLAEGVMAVRQVYKGRLTYSTMLMEKVNWNIFDIVSLDFYREESYAAYYTEMIKPYFAFGKPVVVTEVGCCAYTGAEKCGGSGWNITDPATGYLNGVYERNEELQAGEVADLIDTIEGTGAEGIFVFTFVSYQHPRNEEDPVKDLDMIGYGMVTYHPGKSGKDYPDMEWDPKKVFYAVADKYAGMEQTS